MPSRTIADNLNLIIETKEGLQDEIYWKGVEIDDSTPFSAYPADITSIGVVNSDLLSAYACNTLHVRDITISGTIRPHVLNSTFYDTFKGAVTVDSSVQTIPASAFTNNYGIEKIVMPETTTIGGYYAFYNLSSLSHLETVTLNPSYANTRSGSTYCFIHTCSNLRYFLVKEIGSNTASNAYYNTLVYWGVNSDDEPNAKQSLHDSLITYSTDRTGMGMAKQNLYLSTNTINQLTDAEKAEITGKGYTIAS
jgi:hypothetical protein